MKKFVNSRIIMTLMAILMTLVAAREIKIFITNSIPGQYYEIKSYNKSVTIDYANVYTVKDSFTIDFTDRNVKLVYELPLNDANLTSKVLGISVLSDVTYSIEKTKNNLKIIFNNKHLDGIQDFFVEYKIDKGNDYNSEFDIVNHKLYNFDNFTYGMDYSFNINLPSVLNDNNVQLFATKDLMDDISKNFEINVFENVIEGKANKEAYLKDGIYLNLKFKDGYFKNQTDFAFIDGTIISIYIVCFVIFLLLWFLKGRDDKIISQEMFQAPNNMTPLEIGYWINRDIEFDEIFHMLLYWANLGYIKVKKNSLDETIDNLSNARIGDYTFIKVKELDENANDYEKKIFKAFFELGNEEDSKGDFNIKEFLNETSYLYGTLQTYAQDLYYAEESFREEKKIDDSKGYNKEAENLFSAMKVLMFLLWGSAILFYQDFTIISTWNTLPIVIVFITAFLGIFLSKEEFKNYMILAIPILVLLTFRVVNPFVLVLLTLMTFITASVRKRTPEYNNFLGQIHGFKDVISDEKYTLKVEEITRTSSMYFYYVLPYALTLKKDKEWLEKFKEIPTPYWYEGYNGEGLNVENIKSFVDDMKELCAAILMNVNNSATSDKREVPVEDLNK